jgi:flavodoxin I
MIGMTCNVLVILASETGNTKTFLEFFQSNSQRTLQICEDFSRSPRGFDRLAIGTYTWGNGKIPKRLKDYLIKHRHELADKKIFIFGSGNSVYPRFCAAVDGIEKIVSDCGASVKGTFKFEQRFNEHELNQAELEQLIMNIEHWDTE